MEEKESSSLFKMGHSAQERALPYMPDCYVVQSQAPPTSAPDTANIPVIDLGPLRRDVGRRADVVKEIGDACREIGLFQIVNHGICQSTLDKALESAYDFFDLPTREKLKFLSSNVFEPVRYGTSLKDGEDKVQLSRFLLKHYAHPLSEWTDLWPTNPPHYRENMGQYCVEVRKLTLDLIGAITESLGLGAKYLSNKIEDGMQVMAVNCYPSCPDPEKALGLPPHSDHSCLTIVLQSSPGLEIYLETSDDKWRLVPQINGALQVQVGDHLEVLSNGLYKSVVHRVALNKGMTRISIVSLHSLGMDEKMGTAEELVDDQHPKGYKESSFRDFLEFLSKNDLSEGRSSFINTLKIEQ